MFLPLGSVIPSALRRHKIKEKIDALQNQATISDILKKTVGEKATVMRLRNNTLFLKPKNHAAASELKMREPRILEQLKQKNFRIRAIKYVP